jgi:osmotically-inducible protein OsmY
MSNQYPSSRERIETQGPSYDKSSTDFSYTERNYDPTQGSERSTESQNQFDDYNHRRGRNNHYGYDDHNYSKNFYNSDRNVDYPNYTTQDSQSNKSWRASDPERFRRPDSKANFRGVGPKSYQKSDERLREDICEALIENIDIDASDIEVQVKSGEITLTGSVPDKWMKYSAEDVIENMSHVTDIQNDLYVQSKKDKQKNAQTPTKSKMTKEV